ncbi:MAG: hypothetical protein O2868_20500 [Proteobacteria bacterium]|jgi:hypothetical protein|nr:hypothetical protein [Pseudomonadota bacterium]
MTAKRDFKRVVRERMANTGETYTQARAALIEASIDRIDELLLAFKQQSLEPPEGDRIDREHFLIEVTNLAANIDAAAISGATMRKVFWYHPAESRMAFIGEFLSQDGLPTDDLAWAYEQRLILMGAAPEAYSHSEVIDAHEVFFQWVRDHLDDASQGRAFCNPSVWWRWEAAGRGQEFHARMESCVQSLPAQQGNKQERLFLARNLAMNAARTTDHEAVVQLTALWRRILDEPGELPDTGDGMDNRLRWEGCLRQISLIAAKDDPTKAAVSARDNVEWIRAQAGAADLFLGEVAALCLFQGHNELAERYAQEALDAGQGASNPFIYAWRAGGHLGATGDVASTVPLLVEARRHLSAAEITRLLDDQVPFVEYGQDPQLRAVISMRAGESVRPQG